MFDILGQYRTFLTTIMTNIIQEGWWFCWDILWWISSHRKQQKYPLKFSRKVTQCLTITSTLSRPSASCFSPSPYKSWFPRTFSADNQQVRSLLNHGHNCWSGRLWRAQDAPRVLEALIKKRQLSPGRCLCESALSLVWWYSWVIWRSQATHTGKAYKLKTRAPTHFKKNRWRTNIFERKHTMLILIIG